MSARFTIVSDTGMERTNNEDSAAADPDLGLFVIADGMGGHAAGEVASRIAVDATLAAVRARPRPARLRDSEKTLHQALLDANAAVVQAAEERGLHGMGTTLTVVVVRKRSAVIASVGDSRVYLVSPKSGLRQLTTDHTLVALMVERGLLTPEDAKHHPEKHVLTQAIGTAGEVEPQILLAKIPAGGRLLLCTDGLYDLVPAHEIEELASDPDLETAAHSLVARANRHGGLDNVTVVLIEP